MAELKVEIVYARSYNIVHFGRKMVRNAVQNAFLNTLTTGTAFRLEMTQMACLVSLYRVLQKK